MPSYIIKRGKRRLKAHVMVQGKTWSGLQAILRHKSPNITARYLKRLGLDNLKLDDSVFGGPKGKVLTMKTAVGDDE